MPTEIQKYNAVQKGENKLICQKLEAIIAKEMSKADSKVWHRHPVWFLEGNPVVGYSVLKDSVQLLFWSGQSFVDTELQPEGSFKAAQMRYVTVKDIKVTVLRSWLKQAKRIQWDYKNIVKNKGKLVKIQSGS
jgi:hypothetical protein